MKTVRSSSASPLKMDYSSTGLTAAEIISLRSFLSRRDAGQEDGLGNFLEPRDYDSVTSGHEVYEYCTARLRRVLDTVDDVGVQDYVRRKLQLLHEAYQHPAVPSQAYSRAARDIRALLEKCADSQTDDAFDGGMQSNGASRRTPSRRQPSIGDVVDVVSPWAEEQPSPPDPHSDIVEITCQVWIIPKSGKMRLSSVKQRARRTGMHHVNVHTIPTVLPACRT